MGYTACNHNSLLAARTHSIRLIHAPTAYASTLSERSRGYFAQTLRFFRATRLRNMQLTSCLGGTSSRLVSRRAVAPATVRVPAPKMLGPHIPKLPSARGMRAACRAQFSDEVMLGALVLAGAVVPYTVSAPRTPALASSPAPQPEHKSVSRLRPCFVTAAAVQHHHVHQGGTCRPQEGHRGGQQGCG